MHISAGVTEGVTVIHTLIENYFDLSTNPPNSRLSLSNIIRLILLSTINTVGKILFYKKVKENVRK